MWVGAASTQGGMWGPAPSQMVVFTGVQGRGLAETMRGGAHGEAVAAGAAAAAAVVAHSPIAAARVEAMVTGARPLGAAEGPARQAPPRLHPLPHPPPPHPYNQRPQQAPQHLQPHLPPSPQAPYSKRLPARRSQNCPGGATLPPTLLRCKRKLESTHSPTALGLRAAAAAAAAVL